MNPIVVIPARMASTRLPGKPLADIGGRPMILHVLARAIEAALGPVAVACCEPEVAAAVQGAGGTAILTDPALPSGSDRVQAALASLDPHSTYDVVVNLQGDLPTIGAAELRAVLLPLADPAIDIATLVAPITEAAEAAAESVVKAACDFADGAMSAPALYFSRRAIPWGEGPLWHHIGVYAWRRPALARFVALPESTLERREKLEQLRALQAGLRIGCARVEQAAFGVDTPADLSRARAALAPDRPIPAPKSGRVTEAAPEVTRPPRCDKQREVLPPATRDTSERLVRVGRIAFQGRPGAYSDLACRAAYPGWETLPCDTFEAAIEAVHRGRAALAMLPCENSLAGRVPDIHALLPGSGLSVVGEHFQRVEHCLLGVRGATIGELRRAHSHAVALGQVRGVLRELGLEAVVEADTAGSAQLVAQWNRKEEAAIASALAAEIYGLDILRSNVEDAPHNTTRFYVTARHPEMPPANAPELMTTFVFRVRNVPAALYKALGGFATNGVNMTKLESYMVDGEFTATQFLCDVDGHPEQPALRRAFEELSFFSNELRVLGVYAKAPFRGSGAAGAPAHSA